MSEAELARRQLNFEIFRKEHGERYERRYMSLGEKTGARRKGKTISEILKTA